MNLFKKILSSSTLLALSTQVAYADVIVHDYTQQFNEGYYRLKNKNVNKLKKYILHYELVTKPQVSSIFFDGHPVPRDPRIEANLNQYAKNLPELVKSYKQKAPEIKAIAAEVEQKSQDTFGMKVNANVLLSTSVSDTDAVTTGSSDSKLATVALNMRALVKYSKAELRIVIAHELFHVLQHQIQRDHSATDLIASNLYSEGWATYASSLVYPGYSDWKYISYFTKDDKQFLKFEADRKNIIKDLLRDWNTHSDQKFDKYFSADTQASKPFEPRSGYYIGYMVAKTMAETQSPVKVALIKYDDFKKQIKPLLKKMSEVG